MKLKVARHLLNMLYQILQLRFVSFQQNKDFKTISLISNILYMNMLCITHFS